MATGHVVYSTISADEAATKLTEMEAARVGPEIVAVLNQGTHLLVKHREQPPSRELRERDADPSR